jgi:hypothetical protein
MIINHVPELSPIKQTDTDRLPDMEAMIVEKAEELRKLCYNARHQCVLLVDAKGAEDGGSYSFFNVEMKTTDVMNNAEDKNKAYSNMIFFIDSFLANISRGSCRVVFIKKE